MQRSFAFLFHGSRKSMRRSRLIDSFGTIGDVQCLSGSSSPQRRITTISTHTGSYNKIRNSIISARNIPTTCLLSTSQSDNTKTEDSTETSSHSTSYHTPVMLEECINALLPSSQDRSHPLIFIDATLGGGGHSSALLSKLQPGDIVIGCDQDPSALSTSTQRLSRYLQNDPNLPTFVPIQSNFRDLERVLRKTPHPFHPDQNILNDDDNNDEENSRIIDGMLFDLGVSSYQIDTPERGFSFMKNGPLDMRMNTGRWSSGSTTNSSSNVKPSTFSASDIVNTFSESDLTHVFKTYGDVPRARKIARVIIASRPMHTTEELTEAVAQITPEFSKYRRMSRMPTLARIFQSLRIVVNEEDRVLKDALEETAPKLVRKTGRLVVLSYHSVEDRITKRVMRDGSVDAKRGWNEERDMYGNYVGKERPWKMFGKGKKASEEEVERNSRARSATLRVAERVF